VLNTPLAAEESPGLGLEGDYTDGGGRSSYYLPIKVHIEWQVEDFPYIEEWDRVPNTPIAAD
jgi:hypothetical protein